MAVAKTILIVDDDREIVDGLKLVLEDRGYCVITAYDGDAGLTKAVNEQPDVVILDMMMPKKSGFLVLDALKLRSAASPKVMMMTANEGDRHRAYAELLGVDDYLNKPFPLDTFLQRVEQLCPAPNAKSTTD